MYMSKMPFNIATRQCLNSVMLKPAGVGKKMMHLETINICQLKDGLFIPRLPLISLVVLGSVRQWCKLLHRTVIFILFLDLHDVWIYVVKYLGK